MKKTAVAVAVAVSALGLSQFAAADFVKDSKLSLDLRNYYFAQEDDMDNNANDKDYGQWGQAFMLNYKSGFTAGTVGFGLDFTGLAGYRLADHGDAAQQLFPVVDGDVESRISKSGATLKARVAKTELHVGTLRPNTPVLVANDARLLPQLFEGAQVTSKDIDGLTLTAAQLWKHYGRAAQSWGDLGQDNSNGVPNARAGLQQGNFTIAGADYKIMDNLTAQYYYGALDDYYDQHFAGLKYAANLGAGKLATDLRYFDTSSDSATAKNRGQHDNSLWSALVNYSISGHTFGLGYQSLSGDQFEQLNNAGTSQGGMSTYVITERMIERMTNEDETVMIASYGYNFAQVGIPGLSASVLYQKGEWDGSNKKDLTETETDLVIGYVVPEGQLKGLGVRLQHGMYKGEIQKQTLKRLPFDSRAEEK